MDSGAKEDEELARFNEWVSSERGKAVVRGNIATLRMSAERDIQAITRYYESIRRDTPLRMEEFTRRVTTDDDDSYKKTIEAAVEVNKRKAAFQKSILTEETPSFCLIQICSRSLWVCFKVLPLTRSV